MSQSKETLFGLPPRDLDHIASHTAPSELGWLRDSSIFITGGTGFFGKWLLGALDYLNRTHGLGMSIAVLSRDPGSFLQKYPDIERAGFQFVRGHIADFTAPDLFADFIIHAATDTTAFTRESDEHERGRAIIEGTRHLLEFASRQGGQLLNISSGAVYGTFAAHPNGAKEDDFPQAKAVTSYGEAKREAEQLCAESDVHFCTARAFAFLGPHLPLDAHFAAGNFLRDAVRGGPILVRGDGTALRSYLHPADLVVWLLRLLIREWHGRAYNVGSDEAVTTAQLARAIADAVSPKPEVVIQSTQPQGPQNVYLPDISRARAELALDVAIPLRDAIARTLPYLQAQ